MPEEKETGKIVDGKVVEKTKFQKAVSLFFAEDMDTVTDSVMDDFFKPRLKRFGKEATLKLRQFIADSLKGCIDIVIFGNNKKSDSSYGSYSSGTYKNYSVYYSDEYGTPSRSYSSVNVDDYGFKLIEIPSYGKCEEVKTELMKEIGRYGKVSIAKYYEFTGIRPVSTDYNYGWKGDLSPVKITPYRDGYLLDLPRPVPM